MKNVLNLFCALSLMMSASAFSQQKDSVKVDVKAKKDTVNTAKPKDKKPEKIQPFEKVITNKAVSDEGIITVHKVEDKIKGNCSSEISIKGELQSLNKDVFLKTSNSLFSEKNC